MMMMTFKSSYKRLLYRRHGFLIAPQRSLHFQQQQQQRIFSSSLALDFRWSFHSAASTGEDGAVVSSYSLWGNGGVMMPIFKAKISPTIMTRILEPHQGSRCSSREMTKRFFFASSTDHSTLLAQAEIHVLPVAANTTATADNENDGVTTTTTQQIVLAPSGMDVETVRKVPQLHMARLLLTTTTNENNEIIFTLHSAKVVNRSLGSTVHVCRRLLEYAMTQQQQQGKKTSSSSVKIVAKSTLHGLSDWVLNLLKKNSETKTETTKGNSIDNNVTDFVASLSSKECQIVQSIAKGDMTPFHSEHDREEEIGRSSRTAAELWDKLARLYLLDNGGGSARESSSEAALYQSLGNNSCCLVAIEQQADTSDYSTMAGGAMAVFQLS